MKIRFEPDDGLPLGKILSIPVTVITGSVFQEGNKCYPEVLSYEFVYKSGIENVSIVLLVLFLMTSILKQKFIRHINGKYQRNKH